MRERKRNRMINFDYSSDNLYFVTSCTKDRIHYFGEIANSIMILNEMGKIAQQQWKWLTEQYAYIKSHAFVVMPNHIHGILEINHNYAVAVRTDRNYAVRTGRDLSLQRQKIKSLSQLLGAYKTTTSKKIHLLGYDNFTWQRSFHDHIIRNENSLKQITTYINNNALQWNEDMFNKISEETVK